MNNNKFYDLYKYNIVSLDMIEDYIEDWHTGDSCELINEYLGLTDQQYSKWVSTGKLNK